MANNMASANAQKLARKVMETAGSNKMINYGKLMVDVGYSPKSALNPQRITRTKAYQNALAVEKRPLIDGLQSQINRIKDALAKKDLDIEETKVLVYSLDILTKNYQLLSGGATERQVFVMPSEVIAKNTLPVSEEKQLLDNGSIEPSNE